MSLKSGAPGYKVCGMYAVRGEHAGEGLYDHLRGTCRPQVRQKHAGDIVWMMAVYSDNFDLTSIGPVGLSTVGLVNRRKSMSSLLNEWESTYTTSRTVDESFQNTTAFFYSH